MSKKIYTKNQILEAAYQITRDYDLESLSMRAIARHIGCSVMPIYDSFNSKEDLVFEVNKYSLRKTLYDLTCKSIEDRYDNIIEFGFKYPQFFLNFVRFEKTFKHDDEVVCKLCGFLKKDERMKLLTDQDVLKIDGRIEAFITGVVHTYYKDEYNEKVVSQVKKVTRDTLSALISHVSK